MPASRRSAAAVPTLTTVYMLPVSAVKAVADSSAALTPSWATGMSKRKTLSPLSRQALRWPFLPPALACRTTRRSSVLAKRAVTDAVTSLVAGLVVRAVAGRRRSCGRGVAQDRGRAVGREDAHVHAPRGQAGEVELRGLVRRARAVVRQVVLAGVVVVGDARGGARGRRLRELDDVRVPRRVRRAVVPVVDLEVVRGVAVGVSQTRLEELHRGGVEAGAARVGEAAGLDLRGAARVRGRVGDGRRLERDAVAHRREVVDILSTNTLGVREDLDVDVEFHLVVGALVADGVDRGPRAVQVRVDLDGLEVAEVLREGEVVLDLVPRVDVDAGAGRDLRADHGARGDDVVRHGLERGLDGSLQSAVAASGSVW